MFAAIHVLDLVSDLSVPLEWLSLSSDTKSSTDSGVENMDWVVAALKRIVEFAQTTGAINVLVCGMNVGFQHTGTPKPRCSYTPRASW